ncbi:hypothetical protein NC652_029197 [Populus alba x Populus x berolinensis]|nr:hypothetical protein NC652_029197 [Populus alba x Populus x berolinensis]
MREESGRACIEIVSPFIHPIRPIQALYYHDPSSGLCGLRSVDFTRTFNVFFFKAGTEILNILAHPIGPDSLIFT